MISRWRDASEKLLHYSAGLMKHAVCPTVSAMHMTCSLARLWGCWRWLYWEKRRNRKKAPQRNRVRFQLRWEQRGTLPLISTRNQRIT